MQEVDLVICIYACYTIDKYKRQMDTINFTWGKTCQGFKKIHILYFLGEEKLSGYNDSETIKYINLKNVSNDYLSASYKQFLGLKYIHEHYTTKFIICVGTDTYLNIPKLVRYIQPFDHNDCLYIGGHGCERQIGSKKYYFHSGGPGFIISCNALKQIYDLLPTLMEQWIHICNVNRLHNLIPACDVAISYFLQELTMNLSIIKTPALSFTHCNYKGYPCHQNEVDMKNLMSCHLMSETDFHEFTDLLIENNYFL